MSVPAGLAAAMTGIVVLAYSSAPKEQELGPEPNQGWRLEFRILANLEDDDVALAAAQKYFRDANNNPDRMAELRQLAEEGKPPPPVNVATDKAPGYSWVEASDAEVRSLCLTRASVRKGPMTSGAPSVSVWRRLGTKGRRFQLTLG
jgi:hypothetical protein